MPTATFHPPAFTGVGKSNKTITRNVLATPQAQMPEASFGNPGAFADEVIAYP
jgi:hypothetical protein